MEDRRDAVGVFEWEEAGENAGSLPRGFGGPGCESGEQSVESGGVFVGDDDVISEALDPAVGCGGETVGGGAGLGKGFELGRGDPRRGEGGGHEGWGGDQ